MFSKFLRRSSTLVKQSSRSMSSVDSVTLKVPATSANLGPAFDTMGIALDVWNDLHVEKSDKFEMIVTGEGEGQVPCDESNLICRGLAKAYELAGEPVPPLKYVCHNRIPYARGMGSSSAGIVSGVLAGLLLSGHRLSVFGSEEFLQIASDLEGHADNVAPAIYGGLQIGCYTSGSKRNVQPRWYSSRVNCHHGIQATLFIPDTIAETKVTRGLLPEKYDKAEVVYNIQRMAILVNAFSTGNLKELCIGTEDAMHQPYRSPVFKHMYPLIHAANEAGAHCAYLSGAGPTIMAYSSGGAGDAMAQQARERCESLIGEAMVRAALDVGVTGRLLQTRPTQTGAYVTKINGVNPRGMRTLGN